MAQHVRMNREGKFGQLPSPADHFEEPGPRDRPAAFGVENLAALQVLASQLAQCPDFLAGEGMRAIDAVLGPPHMDSAAIKLDHVPGQFAEFAGAKTVSVGDQDCGRVAVPIPGILPGSWYRIMVPIWDPEAWRQCVLPGIPGSSTRLGRETGMAGLGSRIRLAQR